MKSIVKLSVILLMWSLCGPPLLMVAQDAPSVDSEEIIINLTEEPQLPDSPRRNRLPAHQFFCLISKSGAVIISGFDSDSITSFEIYDSNGNPLVTVEDEASFIEFLFSMHGEVRIVLRLSNLSLTGWVEICS